LSLLVLPQLFGESVSGFMLVFVVFYGMDFIATVPPTVALCREHFGMSAPIVFGWVFAAHQLGAAVSATAAGMVRDVHGDYAPAFYVAGTISVAAAVLSLHISRTRVRSLAPAAVAA
jgi:predicted MFS family arabinose efflux permease